MSKLEYTVTRIGDHEEHFHTQVTITNALNIDLTTDGDSMSVYHRTWGGGSYALIFGEATIAISEACAKQLVKKLDAQIMDDERADDAA
jgi:hypothetical protein